MDHGDTIKIDVILKNFLEEMDKLQKQYRAIVTEPEQPRVPENNA